jgi:hypothetical protein
MPREPSASRTGRWLPALVAVVLAAGCGGREAPAVTAEDWTVPPAGVAAQLSARVTFDAMQITTENLGTDRWRDVVIDVRRGPAGRTFSYKVDVLIEGRRLPMGALNFEASDGRRLSPFEGAPTEWRVSATLPDDRRGVATGRVVEVAPK